MAGRNRPPTGDLPAFCAAIQPDSVSGSGPGTVEFAEQFRPALEVAPIEVRPLLEAWLADPADDQIFGELMVTTVALCGGRQLRPDPFCDALLEYVSTDPSTAARAAAYELLRELATPEMLATIEKAGLGDDRAITELIGTATACELGRSPESVTPPE